MFGKECHLVCCLLKCIKCKPGFILVGHPVGTEISETSLNASLLVQIAAAADDDDDDVFGDHDNNE